jgi:predicted dehydrogenase
MSGRFAGRQGPIRLGMVGGGEGAFIGAVHRIAARLDGHFQLVAGALSAQRGAGARLGRAVGLAEDRIYDDFAAMAQREARLKDGIEAVAIVTPNHLHYPVAREFLEARHPRHLRQAADRDAGRREAACEGWPRRRARSSP